MLEVRNIVKTYKLKKAEPVKALDDVSIKFPDTGLIFILGKSGSGKSTFLNVLGGLDKADSGEIIIKDKSSKDFSQADFDSYRNTYLGFIFQEYNILNEFTVGKNISLAIELQGRKATKEEVDNILEQVDLKGYAKRKPNELSGGQKQRVAIARALVKNPEIIMADEPTGALDSRTGIQVFDTLKELSKSKLVIVVSHDREFAESYGDRVIEFKDGKVISDIEKYKVEGFKKNESISVVDDKIISIKKGYKLTPNDIEMLNNYLTDNDALISVDETSNRDLMKFARIDDNGFKDSFKPTEEEKIVNDKSKPFKLIKSRLPYKTSLKMGGSSLKTKPIRLFFTILLSVVAFTLFGLADTLSAYSKDIVMTNSLAKANMGAISFSKEKKIDEYSQMSYSISDADVEKISKETGLKYDKVVSIESYETLNFHNNIISTDYGQYTGYYIAELGGFTEFNQDRIQELNFNLIGKAPSNSQEVVVTKYCFDTLKKDGYKGKSFAKNENLTIVKNDFEKVTEEQFLNQRPSISLNYIDYEIVGILDTHFEPGRYENAEGTGENIGSYILNQELKLDITHSYHGLVYCSKTLIDEETDYTKRPYFTSRGGLVLGDKSGGRVFNNIINLEKFNNIDGTKVFFQQKGKTSLADNEVIISADNYVSMVINYYDNSGQEAPDYLKDYYQTDYDEKYYEWSKNKFNTYFASIQADAEADPKFSYGYATEEGWTKYTDEKLTSMTDEDKWGIIYNYLLYYYLNTSVSWSKYTGSEINDELIAYSNYKFDTYDYNALLGDYNIHFSNSSITDSPLYYSQDAEQTYDVKIVGFYALSVDDYSLNEVAILSDNQFESIKPDVTEVYSFILTPIPTNKDQLSKLVKYQYHADSNGKYYKMADGTTYMLESANSIVSSLKTTFIWVGVFFAIFASLLLANFISTSISYKKKEIGILRAVGAKSSDVFGIFFNESMMIALINYVISFILVDVIARIINNTIMNNFNLPISLLNFGLRQLGIMLLISIGVAFIASVIPVYRVAKKRPVDAIRKN